MNCRPRNRSVDDRYCTTGTAHIDNRSFRLNFEIPTAIADADFAGPAGRMLERDFSDSTPAKAEELWKRGFWFRFAMWCARLMAPVQGPGTRDGR